jgi:O-antigen/teichoic acid export membrane protein
MPELLRQSAIVAAFRVLNQALLVASPLVLVRVFDVEAFGYLREFLLYGGLLATLAAFSLPNALLWLVGRDPAHAVLHVRRIALALGVASVVVVTAFAVLQAKLAVVAPALAWPCVLYALFAVNLDVWEYLWIAQRRAVPAFLYSTGRIVARLLVLLGAALATRDVQTVVLALVAFEVARCVLTAVSWQRWLREPPAAEAPAAVAAAPIGWRELLAYAAPGGAVVAVATVNRSLGGIWVGETLGNVALALLVIGGYVLAIVAGLRNAISDVLLPRLAARARPAVARLATTAGRGDPQWSWLVLWQRSTVLSAAALVPPSLLLWRFADEFVVTLFGEEYRAAAPLVRAHCPMLALACIDAALVQRALGGTRSMLGVSTLSLIAHLLGLAWAVPRFGLEGAAWALVAANAFGVACLVMVAARRAGIPVVRLLPLDGLARVVLAAAACSPLLFSIDWTARLGLAGVALGTATFLAALVVALGLARVEPLAELRLRLARPQAR